MTTEPTDAELDHAVMLALNAFRCHYGRKKTGKIMREWVRAIARNQKETPPGYAELMSDAFDVLPDGVRPSEFNDEIALRLAEAVDRALPEPTPVIEMLVGA